MAGKGIDNMPNENALARIAQLIDASHAPRRKAGIERALGWCDRLESRGLTAAQATRLDYYRANAWDARRPKGRSRMASARQWEQPELQEEIYFLRRARRSSGFGELHQIEQCQILTNLGNQLSAADSGQRTSPSWLASLTSSAKAREGRRSLGGFVGAIWAQTRRGEPLVDAGRVSGRQVTAPRRTFR
jgi:hypothetical protein